MWCCNRYPSKLFLLRLVRGPQSQWETWFVRRRQGFIFWGRKRLQTRILENGSVILLSSSSYFLFFLLQLFLFTIHSKDVQVTKYINNLSTISIRSRTYMYKPVIIFGGQSLHFVARHSHYLGIECDTKLLKFPQPYF